MAVATTHRTVIAAEPNGLPRTYRLDRRAAGSQAAAYRRLAVAILGLDVATLAARLSHFTSPHTPSLAHAA